MLTMIYDEKRTSKLGSAIDNFDDDRYDPYIDSEAGLLRRLDVSTTSKERGRQRARRLLKATGGTALAVTVGLAANAVMVHRSKEEHGLLHANNPSHVNNDPRSGAGQTGAAEFNQADAEANISGQTNSEYLGVNPKPLQEQQES